MQKILKLSFSLIITILFFIIFSGNVNAAIIQMGDDCNPTADQCFAGQCMPSACDIALKEMDYECRNPEESQTWFGTTKTRAEFQYNADEIAMCERGESPVPAWTARMKGLGGRECTTSSDCPSGQNCLATDCNFTDKKAIMACTTASKPNLSAADIAKCQAGTLEKQLKLEGECAAKAPTDRGIFTKGLSDLCAGCGICSQKDVFQEFINIFTFILQISGSLAVLILVVSGLMYMTAGGDQQKTGQAKAALTAAIVGIIIVLTSFLLISFVMSLIGYTNAGSWFSPTLK